MERFRPVFRRRDTLRQAERYLAGLLSDLGWKNGQTMEAGVPGATQHGIPCAAGGRPSQGPATRLPRPGRRRVRDFRDFTVPGAGGWWHAFWTAAGPPANGSSRWWGSASPTASFTWRRRSSARPDRRTGVTQPFPAERLTARRPSTQPRRTSARAGARPEQPDVAVLQTQRQLFEDRKRRGQVTCGMHVGQELVPPAVAVSTDIFEHRIVFGERRPELVQGLFGGGTGHHHAHPFMSVVRATRNGRPTRGRLPRSGAARRLQAVGDPRSRTIPPGSGRRRSCHAASSTRARVRRSPLPS